MDLLQDSNLSKDRLLADVFREKPGVIEQLALCLDREMRQIPNWKHLFRELKVDAEVITGLEQYTDISPTIRLFEHLEITQPDLTIQQLKQAFSKIGRNDLYSLLTSKAGCADFELVNQVITSRSTEVPSLQGGLLDEMALALDIKSKVLANWKALALELGVPKNIFKQFDRRSPESPTNQLFEYLASNCPQMTLKPLKEALEKMTRNDLLKPLLNLKDEVLLKDVMTPDSELLLTVANELDIDHVPWAENWRKLASYLKIPNDVYLGFGDTTTQRKSPTKEVMQWLVARRPDMTLTKIVVALDKIQRNDAIQIITKEFPDTVDCFLERLGSSLNTNLSLDLESSKTSTAETFFAPSHESDEFTCRSFHKQENLKHSGHCGSLPDSPFILKGREDTCKQIITSLMSNNAVEVVAPPGYGKTSVVVEAAHRLIEKHGKFIAYVNPRGVTCVEDLGCRIIEALGEVPGENTTRETMRRIRCLKNVVLIIENLDNLLHLADRQEPETFRPHSEECCAKMRGKDTKDDFLTFIKQIGQTKTICLVLTSTETNDFCVSFPIDLIKLCSLGEEDSAALFKERDKSLDEATVKSLVTICGGIPLIICTVLSLLKTRNPKNLTRRLSSCTPRELIKELSPEYLPFEDRIDQCLKVCFHRLSQENQDVLVMLSTFPYRFTQEQFFAVFRSVETDYDLERCVDSLKHSSLLRFERESCYFSIHPFIRKFCSTQKKHKDTKSLFIRYYCDLIDTLSDRFLSRDSKSSVEQYRDEKDNIKEAVAWCEDDNPDLDQTLTNYSIDAFNKAAVFLAKMMRKQEFESIFCKLLNHCHSDLERQSACITAIGMKIVLSCTCTPQICSRAWYRASTVLSRANAIQSRIETVDDATRAQCLSKLGFCYVREGRTDDGFEYLNQSLTLREKRFRQSDKDIDKVMIAACQNDLAASLMLQRKHMAAIEIRRSVVLPDYKLILGNDHPFVATTLSWIGKSYHELGEYDNAIKYATQALQIREALLGRHPETARSHYDLGVALSAKKDYTRALKHLEHAVELQEDVLDTHEELILTHQATAVVLKELGRDEEAKREMERARKGAEKLDSLQVPLQNHEGKGWQKTDPVPIESALSPK